MSEGFFLGTHRVCQRPDSSVDACRNGECSQGVACPIYVAATGPVKEPLWQRVVFWAMLAACGGFFLYNWALDKGLVLTQWN